MYQTLIENMSCVSRPDVHVEIQLTKRDLYTSPKFRLSSSHVVFSVPQLVRLFGYFE